MVAAGAPSSIELLACFFGFDFVATGVKADLSTSAILLGFQVVVILSGNEGSSRIKTSSEERRPRTEAECMSSCLRTWPMPSASPVTQTFVSF